MDKWRTFLPWGLLVAFGFFVYAPLLWFGRAFLGEEQSGFYYAISYYVDMALAQGLPLLWQPGYFGGVSTSLDQFYGNFYPVNLVLFNWFDFFFAHHLSIAFATTVGLLCCYWYGRLLGWRAASSIILALGYFSATTYGWIQIGTLAAHSFAVLPALLVALQYVASRHYTALAILGGGVALGVGFLAGFVQVVFYVYVVAGLYALFLDYESWQKSLVWYRQLRASISYTAITLLGLLVGLFQFLPSASLIDLTIRTSTYATQNAVYSHISEVVAFVLPPYFDVPFFGSGHAHGLYIGAIGFVFVVLGLLYYRTRTVLFFAAVYAVVAAFAFHLPVFGWINEHLPPFSHMGGNFRWLVAGAFPLAFLGAAGVEGFLRAPERIGVRAQRIVLWGSAVFTACLVLGSLALSAITRMLASPDWIERLIHWYTQGRTLAYPMEHYQAILGRTLADFGHMFALTSPRFLFAILTWVGVLAFFAYTFSSRASKKVIVYALVSLTFMTVGGTVVLQWSDLVPQVLYAREPALATELHSRETDLHSYRILGYLVGDGLHTQLSSKNTLTSTDMTRAHLEAMTNNTTLFWGIERIDGMEPYRLLRYNRLLNTVLAYDWATFVFDRQSPALATSALDQLYNRDVQKRVSTEEKLKDIGGRVPLLSMMNVKYVYSPYELSAPGLTLIKKLDVAIGEHTLVLYLYENASALPRAYFAGGVSFESGSDTDALLRVVDNPDFLRTTIIECEDCTAVPGKKGQSTVVRYDPGEVEVHTASQKDEWLVLSESMLPGWNAYIDGEETPLYTANYLFMAIKVPAGEHTVSFGFRDANMLQLGALTPR